MAAGDNARLTAKLEQDRARCRQAILDGVRNARLMIDAHNGDTEDAFTQIVNEVSHLGHPHDPHLMLARMLAAAIIEIAAPAPEIRL